MRRQGPLGYLDSSQRDAGDIRCLSLGGDAEHAPEEGREGGEHRLGERGTYHGDDGGQDQGVAIPNQNSAKLSVSPCFARVRFRSPVFCPFLPIFCLKMGKKWAKTGKFGFVCFCLNSPEFARLRLSYACAVRHPLFSTFHTFFTKSKTFTNGQFFQ